LWHWSEAVQITGFAPVQTPAWQESVCVHASLSSHAVSSGCLASAGHAPSLPVHTSSASHWSLAPRQTVSAATKRQPLVQHELGSPLSPPWSHSSPASAVPSPQTIGSPNGQEAARFAGDARPSRRCRPAGYWAAPRVVHEVHRDDQLQEMARRHGRVRRQRRGRRGAERHVGGRHDELP
jgi:hypothetical protein